MLGQRDALERQWRTAGRQGASLYPPYPRPPVVVLANRAPFQHDHSPGGEIRITRSASGLVTAVEPLLAEQSGVWVALASGSADATCSGEHSRRKLPGTHRGYRVRYVSVSDDERRGYYYGFANEALWPLCHELDVRPRFRPDDFHTYREVNRRFAAAACAEAGAESRAILFVHDYHFALAPRMLRTQMPLATVVGFWHIPWPGPDTFRTCPWRREVIEGLLGSHILGFQTPEDCANFLACAESVLPCDVDRRRSAVTYRGRSTLVRAYPVGIDWENPVARAAPPIEDCRTSVRRDLGLDAGSLLGVGIDRLDYTKGIDEKFRAIERLLETRPHLVGRFTFVQVAEPSRDCLPAYQAARAQLSSTCERVNTRFANGAYRPIVLIERHHEPADVYRLYRAADVCYVGSLRDGMNLVAKEFVRARDDERGVLVLSRFAGASRQLAAALCIDPSDTEGCAHALARALQMSDAEQAKRMRHLRRVVRRFDARWWGAEILRDATVLTPQTPAHQWSANPWCSRL